MSCTRLFLFLSLCLLLLLGVLSVALGTNETFQLLYRLRLNHLVDSSTLRSLYGSLVSLGALGALTIALSLSGLFSLRCHYNSMRSVAICNALLLVLLFAAQAFSAVWWPSTHLLHFRDANSELKTSLVRSYAMYEGDECPNGRDRLGELSAETLAWNAMQEQLQCCNVNGETNSSSLPAESIELRRSTRSRGVKFEIEGDYPLSCGGGKTEGGSVRFVGCYRRLRDRLADDANWTLGVHLASAMGQLVVLLATVCLLVDDDDDASTGWRSATERAESWADMRERRCGKFD